MSVSWPSFANLVSLRAAIWMQYLLSSLATRAVLHSGLLDSVLSISVRMFHVLTVSGIIFADVFVHFVHFFVFQPHGGIPRLPR